MVGRTAERVLLREQMEAARLGRGRFVLVSGEAGIGKTTIVRELVDSAQAAGFSVLSGHCYDLMAAAPYGLWLDLGDSYRRSHAETAAPTLPALFATHQLDDVTSQTDVFYRMLAFLRACADTRPALVVLEDVHWADPASIELLRYVASHLDHSRLLLLATYRIDELTRHNPFSRQLPALVRESDGLRLVLGPLSASELHLLVESRYALANDETDRLATYLETRTDGNPFFAVEILQALENQEAGGLRLVDGGWTFGELDQPLVPTLIRQVIELRAGRLGEDCRQALAIAAVIGQDVPVDLWSAAADLDESSLLEVIDRAVDAYLVTASTDGRRVLFAHALIREALYESITPPRRRLVHRSIAALLQRQSPPNADAIAYHLMVAGDPEAPDWLVMAGERAQRAYAWLTAGDRFRSAATLLAEVPGKEDERAKLLYRCGRLLRYSNAESGVQHLQAASALAARSGNPVLRANATYAQGILHCFADQWQTGVEHLRRGVAELEALDQELSGHTEISEAWMADALPSTGMGTTDVVDIAGDALTSAGVSYRRGTSPWFMAACGHLAEAGTMARSFIGLVDGLVAGPLVHSSTAHAWFGLGIVQAALGEVAEARAAMARARELYLQFDHHAVVAFVYLTELSDIVLPYLPGDIAGRQWIADEAERALEQAGGAFPSGISMRRAQLELMYLDGRWSEAHSIASDSAIHGCYVLRRPVTRASAPIARHQGRPGDAWELIHAVLPDGPDAALGSAVLADVVLLQHLAVDLLLDTGDTETARRWLDANSRWLDWSGAGPGWAQHRTGEASLHLALGDLEGAEQRARMAIDLAATPPQPLCLMNAHRLLGQVRLLNDDLDGAERELAKALTIAGEIGSPFERALTQIELANLRLRTDREAAVAMLRDARSVCERLGAHPAMSRIDRMVEESRPESPSPNQTTGLTPREIEVLRLVAQGLTDADIGDRLWISPRTVSHHLQSIYGKLGIRTRSAATRFAMEQGIS
jgi:DNA-binding CsgD family transcriptional regulator/tetratricopeptide (TPR) repeat protein